MATSLSSNLPSEPSTLSSGELSGELFRPALHGFIRAYLWQIQRSGRPTEASEPSQRLAQGVAQAIADTEADSEKRQRLLTEVLGYLQGGDPSRQAPERVARVLSRLAPAPTAPAERPTAPAEQQPAPPAPPAPPAHAAAPVPELPSESDPAPSQPAAEEPAVPESAPDSPAGGATPTADEERGTVRSETSESVDSDHTHAPGPAESEADPSTPAAETTTPEAAPSEGAGAAEEPSAPERGDDEGPRRRRGRRG